MINQDLNKLPEKASFTELDVATTLGGGLQDLIKKLVLNYSHPVGSYLITGDKSYDPNVSLGGEWVCVAEDGYLTLGSIAPVVGNGKALTLTNGKDLFGLTNTLPNGHSNNYLYLNNKAVDLEVGQVSNNTTIYSTVNTALSLSLTNSNIIANLSEANSQQVNVWVRES